MVTVTGCGGRYKTYGSNRNVSYGYSIEWIQLFGEVRWIAEEYNRQVKGKTFAGRVEFSTSFFLSYQRVQNSVSSGFPFIIQPTAMKQASVFLWHGHDID